MKKNTHRPLLALLLALCMLLATATPALAQEEAPPEEPVPPEESAEIAPESSPEPMEESAAQEPLPEEDLSFDKFLSIFELYKDVYYTDVDGEQALLEAFRLLLEHDPDSFALLTNALLQGGDRYSRYMSPERAEAEDNVKVYGGIGVTIVEEGGRLIVDQLNSMDCAAQLAGILVGDQITAIDGVSILNLSMEAVSGLARGDIGTEVTYSIYRASTGELLEFTMEREKMILQTVLYEFDEFTNAAGEQEVFAICRINDFEGFLTYLEFVEFKNTFLEVGASRILFDLRDNPGGDFDVTLELINWLIPEEGKRIVSVLPRDEELAEIYETSGRGIETDRIVILVNENTASAAELMAIALQEHGVATIVGQKTFGKAIGQQVFDLTDGSRVNITTIQIESPNGNRYNGTGVIPDVEVKNTETQRPLPGFLVFSHENFEQAVLDAENPVVEALEQRLMVLGLMTYADQSFGEETARALRLYQRSMGLEETGALDVLTFQSITDLVNLVKNAKYYHDDQYDRALELIKAA